VREKNSQRYYFPKRQLSPGLMAKAFVVDVPSANRGMANIKASREFFHALPCRRIRQPAHACLGVCPSYGRAAVPGMTHVTAGFPTGYLRKNCPQLGSRSPRPGGSGLPLTLGNRPPCENGR